MPRLRTTATLSLLALLVGVGGTRWLTERTEVWPAASSVALAALAPARPVRTRHAAPARRRLRSNHQPMLAVLRRVPPAESSRVEETSAATPSAFAEPLSATTLVPISTPATATPYERLRGHLQGRVLLQLAVDGNGRVRQAAVARSSGDPVLDQHALELIEGWRFAVPADHPDGVSGALPMRFDTGAGLARTP